MQHYHSSTRATVGSKFSVAQSDVYGPVPFMPICAASTPCVHVSSPSPYVHPTRLREGGLDRAVIIPTYRKTYLTVPSSGLHAGHHTTPPGTPVQERGRSSSHSKPSQHSPSHTHRARGRSNSFSHPVPFDVNAQERHSSSRSRPHPAIPIQEKRNPSLPRPLPNSSPIHVIRGRSNSISHLQCAGHWNVTVQGTRSSSRSRPQPTPSSSETPVRERHGSHSRPQHDEHRPHAKLTKARSPSHPSKSARHPQPSVDVATHPNFSHSTCSGKRKAVCIGINYVGQKHELLGCVNDAKNVNRFLIRQCNYKDSDIVLLTDDATHPRSLPTKQNILEAMKWLVKDACPNDSLFLHYSGHGGQIPDKEGDEKDGYDEIIFPMDYKKNGYIVDDLMNDILAKPLPAGCRLTAIFDSCHSGTILDLPYIYSSSGRLKEINITRNGIHNYSPADIICFSACKDSQTSADISFGGSPVGAMSYAFMKALNNNKDITYMQLMKTVREILGKKYKQQTQLCSSHQIDTSLKFIM